MAGTLPESEDGRLNCRIIQNQQQAERSKSTGGEEKMFSCPADICAKLDQFLIF